MRISYNLHDLCIASFIDGDDTNYREAKKCLQDDYRKLYFQLISGEITGFYHKCKPSGNGCYNVYLWTESARKEVPVQRTCFMYDSLSCELIPLSHHSIGIFEDMLDHVPDNVEIETF